MSKRRNSTPSCCWPCLARRCLVSSRHFTSFFLRLELLTVSLVIMIGYLRASNQSLEAGLKYLILATASSAFMLFGLALLYFEFGSMEFATIGSVVRNGTVRHSSLLTIGGALMFVGIGYKLAIVPFHMWTPDIYEGAPAPVTAFVATVPKGAMIAFLLRLFVEAGLNQTTSLVVAVSVLAAASMFIGNFLALRQDNLKRLLAYSSISHMGYLLVAVVAGGTMATGAVGYYVVAYYVTLLAAVGIVSLLSGGQPELMDLEDYRGLFWRRPGVATVLAGAMLSLAGIPLTAGFIGKFLVLTAGVGSALWTLVILLVVNSAIGLSYYLRVTVILFSRREDEQSGWRQGSDSCGRRGARDPGYPDALPGRLSGTAPLDSPFGGNDNAVNRWSVAIVTIGNGLSKQHRYDRAPAGIIRAQQSLRMGTVAGIPAESGVRRSGLAGFFPWPG